MPAQKPDKVPPTSAAPALELTWSAFSAKVSLRFLGVLAEVGQATFSRLPVEEVSDLPWHLREPDITATLSADEQTLRIYAVNSTGDPLPVRFDLGALGSDFQGSNQISLVDWDRARDSEAMNTRDDPIRIAPTEKPLAVRGREFRYTFAPFSVNLLELHM